MTSPRKWNRTMIRMLVFVLAMCVASTAAASHYYLTLGGEQAGDQAEYGDYLLRGTDLFIAYTTEETYQPGARLVKLDADGHIEWHQRYKTIPLDQIRLIWFDNHLLMLKETDRQSDRLSRRAISIWQLGDHGQLVTRRYRIKGHLYFLASRPTSHGLDLLFRKALAPAPLYVVHLDQNLHFLSDASFEDHAGGISTTPRRIYALSNRELRSYDWQGKPLSTLTVPAWAKFVAASHKNPQAVYHASAIFPAMGYAPTIESRYKFDYQSREGDLVRNYHLTQDLDIDKAQFGEDGRLWLLGSSRHFAAMLAFKNGKESDAFHFSSRFERSKVLARKVLEHGDVLVLGETTAGGTRHRSSVFVLRMDASGKFLEPWQRCTTDPIQILELAEELRTKASIIATWHSMKWLSSSYREFHGHDVSPFYKAVPSADVALPHPTQCDGTSRAPYIRFMKDLLARIAQNPASILTGARIPVQVNDDVAPGHIRTVPGMGMEVAPDAAGQLLKKLKRDIYPYLARLSSVSSRIYRESGVSLGFSMRASNLPMSQDLEIYKQFANAWDQLSPRKKRAVEAVISTRQLEVDSNGEVWWPAQKTHQPVKNSFDYLLTKDIPDERRGQNAMMRQRMADKHEHSIAPDKRMFDMAIGEWLVGLEAAFKHGASIDPHSCWESIMVNTAAQYNYTDVAKFLVTHGAAYNTPWANGETPLHIAIKNRSVGVIRLLLKQPDIDVSAKTKYGNTPLDYTNYFQSMLPQWVIEELKAKHAPPGRPLKLDPDQLPGRVVEGSSICDKH